MHTLLFLEPGHFHAALTLRVPHPRVADEIFVYANEGPELRDFLALVERFNRRPQDPTRWHPVVVAGEDPLSRLIAERRGDSVVLAGRNGGKARTIHHLHEAGFHVLADKPWLVEPEDLDAIRPSLDRWPLCMEIITGRHDAANRLFKRLVDDEDVFGAFRPDGPAIELASVHHLEKLVDGAPLRRPWWFFDVRVQGSGVVDIPTHLVDQTQWLADRGGPPETPELETVRAWATRVPSEAFRRITGESGFPRELSPLVDADGLRYLCNTELVYRIGSITARAGARWELSEPPGGGDAYAAGAHGTRADIRMEQGPHTGHRRKLFIERRGDPARVDSAVTDAITAVQAELPGVGVERAGAGRYEVTISRALDTGHESHFPRVLDRFLGTVDDHTWPAALAQRTLAKYTLLARAAARITADHARATEDSR